MGRHGALFNNSAPLGAGGGGPPFPHLDTTPLKTLGQFVFWASGPSKIFFGASAASKNSAPLGRGGCNPTPLPPQDLYPLMGQHEAYRRPNGTPAAGRSASDGPCTSVHRAQGLRVKRCERHQTHTSHFCPWDPPPMRCPTPSRHPVHRGSLGRGPALNCVPLLLR